jgi:hypothetical protein
MLTYISQQVASRLDSWLKRCNSETRQQATYLPQLEWESHVVEYVTYIWHLTKIHGNSKKDKIPTLPITIPLLGPCFLPPTYLHVQKRHEKAEIMPETAYLKPLNIVHPLYYANLSKCPKCDSLDILWDSWVSAGHRDIHGLHEEETALGYQLCCKACRESKGTGAAQGHTGDDENGGYCFAITNHIFWNKWQHWQIPRQSF